jgi:hypothetical protein
MYFLWRMSLFNAGKTAVQCRQTNRKNAGGQQAVSGENAAKAEHHG